MPYVSQWTKSVTWASWLEDDLDDQSQKHLTDLDYADDVTLIAEYITSAQTLLVSFEDTTAKVGLLLNSKKTECMVMNEDPVHQGWIIHQGSRRL